MFISRQVECSLAILSASSEAAALPRKGIGINVIVQMKAMSFGHVLRKK